jgi:hypothetical protein
MPKSLIRLGPVACIVLLSTPFSFAFDQAALAQEACLAHPNRTASPGTHWYYRIDRPTHRQCWYLKDFGTKPRVTAPQEAALPYASPQVPANAGDEQGFMAWLSSVWKTNKRPNQAAPDTPAPQVANRNSVKQPPRPAPKARHADVARASPPATPRAVTEAQDADVPLDEAKRAELFQEFLRWRQQQLLTPDR